MSQHWRTQLCAYGLPSRSLRLLRVFGIDRRQDTAAHHKEAAAAGHAALGRALGLHMERLFAGRSILIAEDEPLIALAIQEAFEEQGARVTIARTLKDAAIAVHDPRLSAAILDHGLLDGDTSTVRTSLQALNIPCVVYSGWSDIPVAGANVAYVKKPATTETLVDTVAGLIARQTVYN